MQIKKKQIIMKKNNMKKTKIKKSKISQKTKLSELFGDEKAVELLFKSGMGCIGCHMAMQETLEQGCKAHGMSEKEISELIKKLNGER